MKTTDYKRFEDLEDKYFGEKGTPGREEYEFDFIMELIGEKIKQLRIQNNLTQSQLGELIGVKRSQISKLEHGNHSASVSTIMKVFQAMKAKVKLKIETDDNLEFAF
ncbi:MAG TPA: helix-turn-helix transcriptional regulator [Bacteroidales bacterium]|nr:helix-turn-helix transcriptional regulator [Bacteroidales bacterium]